MKYKILLTTTSFQDSPGDHHKILKEQNWDVDYIRGPVTADVLLPIIHNYDGIICGDDEYSENVLIKGSNGKLKAISKYGVGLDKINLDAAKKLNIKVTNVPGINHVSVSEHVLALLFSFQKNIHLQYNSVQLGSWHRLVGYQIEGKNIGIIGLGAVGKELAKKSHYLGMKVFAFDVERDDSFLKNNSYINMLDSIDELYSLADIISLHVPHNKNTNEMINKNIIKKIN